MKKIILMLQFLTTIPIRYEVSATQKDFGKSMAYAPIAGLVIGALLVGVHKVAELTNNSLFSAVAVVIFYLFITGGLHIDGLGDSFDGLFSGRSKERMLEIMRDSRVGTNAVIVVFSVLILNIASINAISTQIIYKALILMPVIGRLGSVCSAGMSGYARSGEGLGKAFIDYCGFKEILIGVIITSVVSLLLFGYKGLIFVVAAIIFTYLFVKFVEKRIGGMTGDTCGAGCELNQTLFLILLMVI